MGALLTQHPDSVAVVMSAVGIYDMLRVELSPNGAFNIPEFGTVEDPAQFEALYAYSPYHRVVDGMLGGSFVRRVADHLEGFDLNRPLEG